jgi:dihydroorotate dehydrogenase (fumarate)
MADVRVSLCGVELRNPFIASSGPLTYGAKGIRRCFAAGAAAAVTKTLCKLPAENPIPHIVSLGKGTMLNTEKWADLSVQQWVEQEFPALRGADGMVIASLGHTVEEVELIAPQLARVGDPIRMLEVVSYRAVDMVPMVKAAKRLTDFPVLAKISPNWPDLMEVVDGCLAAGADGITAADSLGPVLHIDIETARPALSGDYGYAWMSGTAIKPVIVRIVADICRRHPDVPVVATGGVTTAEDAVEMFMVGATAIGAQTAPMLQGVSWFEKTANKLAKWLDAHGYRSPAEVRGRALPAIAPGEDKHPLTFFFDADKCTECGRCVTVCAYEARHLEEGKVMRLDTDACRSCGLCVTVCPTEALTADRV